MGLLNKIFRPDRSGPDSQSLSGTQFTESDDQDDEAVEREATRRELVQRCLRETMRRHAVPSDWIDCRMLPVVTSKRKTGLHVQLIVKQGQGSLLTYIPSFQSSLMADIEKFDPHAWDWLLSISWQFAGITSQSAGALPGGGDWRMGASGSTATAASGAAGHPAAADLDDGVAEDLQALFAIRDAALLDPNAAPPEFEPTRPGFMSTNDPRGR
jgi:hypothetical protein